MNIVSICYGGFPGVNTALQNLSRTVRLSRHFTISSKEHNSPEIKFFADYLRATQPGLVILGAWTPAYQILLDALHPDTLAAVDWSSSSGQVDIAGEVASLGMLLEHPRIHYKFFAHAAFASALCGRPDCFELPHTFPISGRLPAHQTNSVPIISLFCSPNEYRRKNILNSLLAVGMQIRPYILHLNGLSENADYRKLLEQFQIRYHDWGWMTTAQYRRVLRRVDVGLQLSFAESFDYVAADHIQLGIPVLVSRMVPALHHMPARVRARLVLDNPDDPVEIAAQLEYLLTHPAARRSLGASARRQLLITNEKNIRQAKNLLLEILAR